MKGAGFVLLLFCISHLPLTSVLAQSYTPGVTAGDWFTYGELKYVWSSSDPMFTPPDNFLQINEFEYYKLSVLNISGTEISVQETLHFKNGSELSGPTKLNILYRDPNTWLLYFISANLEENDTIYPTSPSIWINKTVSRSCPYGFKETNIINATQGSPLEGDYSSFCYSYDKETGVLLEVVANQTFHSAENRTTESLLWRLTESNIPCVPEFPSFLILPLFMITTLLAAIIHRRKKFQSF